MVKDGAIDVVSWARTIAGTAMITANNDIRMILVLEQDMKPPIRKQIGKEGPM
jgi:hypothetical protein